MADNKSKRQDDQSAYDDFDNYDNSDVGSAGGQAGDTDSDLEDAYNKDDFYADEDKTVS